MGETYRGSAVSTTEKTRHMYLICLVCMSLVVAVTVGGAFAVTNALEAPGNAGSEPAVTGPPQDAMDDFECASLPTSRTFDLVLGSKTGRLGPFDTEVGTIEVLSYYFPATMPLCLTEDELRQWYVNLFITGGYELICGYVDVWQKDEVVGQIWLDWTREKGETCTTEFWYITFHTDGIFLDSNMYPDVCEPFELWAPYEKIPGKEVYFDIMTCWQGCESPEQSFSIIPAHSESILDSSMVLGPSLSLPQDIVFDFRAYSSLVAI
ncbi:MAG: hypothetical protein ACXADS_04165 [Candidatus Thorarchaeota archaeon]|jgi:hypothetical protein